MTARQYETGSVGASTGPHGVSGTGPWSPGQTHRAGRCPLNRADTGGVRSVDEGRAQSMRIPEIARAMTSRWISEVPSKIV